MKALTLFLAMVLVAIFAVNAMAVSVTVTGGVTGTYTLNSMTMDSAGNITLNVLGGAPPPPVPGPLTLGLSPTTLPTGTAGTAYTATVTMTASGGTPPYGLLCAPSGNVGITATRSGGSACIISGTPSSSGVVTVNFSVIDSAKPAANTVVRSLSFNVNPTGGVPPPGATQLSQRITDFTIAPNGANYYYFTLDKAALSIVQIYATTGDWTNNVDLIVSNVQQPTCDISGGNNIPPKPAPWYSTTATSNETLYLMQPFAAGTTFYVTVCNRSPMIAKFALYWASY